MFLSWLSHRPGGGFVTYTAVKYAIRAIRDEIFRFRFDYPLETVPEAGPRDSLHYYLYSESLSWDIMKLDPAYRGLGPG